MKKLTVLATILLSTSALAAPVGQTFTGVGVGVDLTTVKYKSGDLKGKQATGANLVVDYGFDQGNELVGLVEGKAKLGSTKIFNDTKQKSQFSLGYKQGYRIADVMPYAKINYNVSKVGDIGSFKGFGYGAGVKYAVSSNIEVGAEYTRENLKRKGDKLKGNAFAGSVGYRF